jgi:hypothetical protein
LLLYRLFILLSSSFYYIIGSWCSFLIGRYPCCVLRGTCILLVVLLFHSKDVYKVYHTYFHACLFLQFFTPTTTLRISGRLLPPFKCYYPNVTFGLSFFFSWLLSFCPLPLLVHISCFRFGPNPPLSRHLFFPSTMCFSDHIYTLVWTHTPAPTSVSHLSPMTFVHNDRPTPFSYRLAFR